MGHACHKPRDQGARGRQGEEGKGEVPCVAPQCGCREGTARTGTRRQRAKDPGAWESGRGRARGNEHTRGRARTESGSGGGQLGGRVASRIASPRASQSRESDEGDRCSALGEHRGRGREQRGQGRGKLPNVVPCAVCVLKPTLTSIMRHVTSVKPGAGGRKRHGGTGTCGAIRRASRAMTQPLAQRGHAPVAPSTGPPAHVAVSVTQRGRAPAAPTGGPPAA